MWWIYALTVIISWFAFRFVYKGDTLEITDAPIAFNIAVMIIPIVNLIISIVIVMHRIENDIDLKNKFYRVFFLIKREDD